MILLIDNYDSFVHNLARYFRRLNQSTIVKRNDRITVDEVKTLNPPAIVLSPGPCTPRDAGESLEIVRRLGGEIPMLGVCLGHQILAAAMGAEIVRAAVPMHGRSSNVFHDSQGVFQDLPTPLTVGRYHSLVVDPGSIPAELSVTAQTQEGVVMAISHVSRPIFGVQFHPESVLTEFGYRMLANFLRLAGIPCDVDPVDLSPEYARPPAAKIPATYVPIAYDRLD